MDLPWPSKPHSERNLAPRGQKFALQAALQMQLSASWIDLWLPCKPQNRALAYTRAQFSYFSALAFQDCLLSSSCKFLGPTWSSQGDFRAALGCTWAPLGLNLEPLERFLDSAWSSWAPIALNLDALRALLGVPWAYLRFKWPPSALQVISK